VWRAGWAKSPDMLIFCRLKNASRYHGSILPLDNAKNVTTADSAGVKCYGANCISGRTLTPPPFPCQCPPVCTFFSTICMLGAPPPPPLALLANIFPMRRFSQTRGRGRRTMPTSHMQGCSWRWQ